MIPNRERALDLVSALWAAMAQREIAAKDLKRAEAELTAARDDYSTAVNAQHDAIQALMDAHAS